MPYSALTQRIAGEGASAWNIHFRAKARQARGEDVIILSVGGMPVEAVAWGTVVYRNAVARGIGQSLNLWDAPVLR